VTTTHQDILRADRWLRRLTRTVLRCTVVVAGAVCGSVRVGNARGESEWRESERRKNERVSVAVNKENIYNLYL
jgi:hypothetical protein